MVRLNSRTPLCMLAGLLISVIIIGQISESDALPKFFACAKDYVVKLVKEKVISRSTIIREYNSTMSIVKQRYEEAKLSGVLENKTEEERENFYYKITVEELRNLKDRIEMGQVNEEGLDGSDSDSDSEKAAGCVDPDAMIENWNPDEESMDEQDELDLLAQLDDLERIAREEAEMGWSLTAEAREALSSRTKEVLVDLLNNEVRQIAMAIISAYLSGGSLAPVLLSLAGNMRFKLADYFINSILDLISSAMGRKVEIRPAPSQVAAA